jgi:hypothetical protein
MQKLAASIVLMMSIAVGIHAQSSSGPRLVTRADLAGKKWAFLSKALVDKTFKAVWTFDADKTVSLGTGPKHTWSIRGKTLRVEKDKDHWELFSLEAESSSTGELVMKEINSSAGKRDNITLTQIKE